MTNKWKLDEPTLDTVLVVRVEDEIPIFSMCISYDNEDGLLSIEQARDVAQQIVDDWNFTCDDLGE